MGERLHQLVFNSQFERGTPLDVTPAGFDSIQFPSRRIEELDRFMRELREPAWATSPQEAAHYLQTKIYTPFDQFYQEEVWVLLLNTKNRITHDVLIYRGTISLVYFRVAEIFRGAVKVGAAGLILSHCHPSGDPTPSPEDRQTTRTVLEAARILGIDFTDHIIVGDGRWVSLKEQGLEFDPF